MPGSWTAATTVMPTARPWVSSSPRACSMRRTTVRSAKAVRVASSSMTMTMCGLSAAGGVLALPVGGQGQAAAGLEVDGLLEEVAHGLGDPALEPFEHAAAEAELHPALGVQCPHLDPAVADRRRQPVQEGPQHRSLSGPGGAGDQGVGALDPEPPRPVVVAAADGYAGQGHLADPHRRDDRFEGVAAAQLEPDPSRPVEDDPGARRRGRPGRRPRTGRRPRPGSARPGAGAAAGRCRRRRTAAGRSGASCGRGRGRRTFPAARPPGRTGRRRRTTGAGTTGHATAPRAGARRAAGTWSAPAPPRRPGRPRRPG